MNHSLAVGSHRARRARVTRDHRIKSPVSALFASIYDNILQHFTTRQTTQRRELPPRCFDGGCWRLLAKIEGYCPMSVPRRGVP